MTSDHEAPRTPDDAQRLELDALAPRAAWVDGLAAIGREALRRRAAPSPLRSELLVAARWFVPAAACVAAACWVVSLSSAAPAPPPRASRVLAADDPQALLFLPLETAP